MPSTPQSIKCKGSHTQLRTCYGRCPVTPLIWKTNTLRHGTEPRHSWAAVVGMLLQVIFKICHLAESVSILHTCWHRLSGCWNRHLYHVVEIISINSHMQRLLLLLRQLLLLRPLLLRGDDWVMIRLLRRLLRLHYLSTTVLKLVRRFKCAWGYGADVPLCIIPVFLSYTVGTLGIKPCVLVCIVIQQIMLTNMRIPA